MVADLGLRGRREQGLRQLFGLIQSRRQVDAADGTGVEVVLPARADQEAADNRFDRQRSQSLDDE